MKYEMWKRAGGKFEPASDMVEEKLKKLKNDEMYEVEIKRVKNPRFHRKMFVFFHYCFEYWNGEGAFFSEPAQFDYFRKELVKAAGFVDTYYSLTGEVRVEAKSLAFGNMEPEEFEECYHAVIQTAITSIFKDCDTEEIYNKLINFF